MYSIYIDTHYIKLVMALYKDEKLLWKKELESNKHSENTVSMLNDLLLENSITVNDIKEIIVVVGPGSFTGVRIGVVVAKILGFTKNIKIKPISYLEILSLNYDGEVTVGIKDRNGAFIGKFNNHELIEDYKYLSNLELESYPDSINFEDKVNYEKLIEHMRNISEVNPHLLKPLYVKRLEVTKWQEMRMCMIFLELKN